MDPYRYQSTSSQYSQRGNGIPPPKRPKLNIDKHSNTSNNSRSNIPNDSKPTTSSTEPKEMDFFDDIWGEEIDEQHLQLIEQDVSLALSQMPNLHKSSNTVAQAQDCAASNKCSVLQKKSDQRLGQVPSNNTLKGVPLRKTASSGWPTSNTAQHSNASGQSELGRLATGGNNLKRGVDIKSGYVPNCSARPGTEQSSAGRIDPNANKMSNKLASNLPSNNNNLKGVPLRRTSSSNWPSANTFSPQPSKLLTSNAAGKPSGSHALHEVTNCDKCDKLHIDYNSVKEKLIRKTGEVSVLRDKLSSTQQEKSRELNKIRKELTDKMNTIKLEAESVINHLSKENKSLKSKLDVDAMEKEISVNRQNQGSPFRSKNNIRLSSKQSLVEDNTLHGQHLVETFTRNSQYRFLYELIGPELVQPTQPEAPISETVRTITNDKLFSDEMVLKLQKISIDETQKIQPSTSTGLQKVQPSTSTSTVQVQPSTSASGAQLQTSTSTSLYTTARDMVSTTYQLLSESCSTTEPCQIPSLATMLSLISGENEQQVISEVVEKCSHIIKSQLNQLESSACPRNKCLEREQEVVHSGYKNLILRDNCNLLLGGKELYNNERGISTRRALALLSVLVEFSEIAASKILLSSDLPSEKRPEKSNPALLSMVKDMVHQIENQRQTLMFEGILASSAKLVTSLLQSKLTLTSQSRDLLLQILRGVVFARPGSLVLHFVLQAVLAATKYSDITDNLCHNSDTCLLQVLCVAVQLAETPRKLLLSDTYTSWVLTLFYGLAQEPRWLFAAPPKTSCQCRPLVSRLAFHLLGEACLAYPTVKDSDKDKKKLEDLLTRGVLVVSTLLYHDEHFGVNVDSISVGYYELFLSSMARFDIQLPRAHYDIMATIIKQEENRTIPEPQGPNNELSSILTSIYENPKESRNVLELLDSL